ncbi:hypothetical protein FF098_017090 [Parvularcula flava]|uniref:Uncharacterized protein n=1 Tax=Aquisalinus luteolus TaxID=1566827 RepID=A0A8J3A4I5_9PROT|nr:hypothetical protein [Aquisalinus luteolus]NHK29626.1 hypothetical protein [Aquisalinus luteolus]GGI02293.1 hypothetical protein GCM10011355_34960 [Aquisalinus luteolus]
MTDTQPKSKPVYRIGFAPYDGVDNNGQRKLGYPIELGSCWQRAQAERGLVAKFRMIPDLRDGVLLLLPVNEDDRPANTELDV